MKTRDAPPSESLRTEEGISMAINELRRVNSDKEVRQIIEAREKEAHLRASALYHAEMRGRTEGRTEGRNEGRTENRTEMIKRLLSLGKSPAEISDLLGVSLEEIASCSPQGVAEEAPPFSKTAKTDRSRKPAKATKRKA